MFVPGIERSAVLIPVETERIEAFAAVGWGASFDVLLGRLGVGALGASAFAARVLIALVSVLGVLAAYWAGSRVGGERVGGIGAVVLATSHHYLLDGRSLAGDTVSVAAIVVALGGFAGFVRGGRFFEVVIGAAGVAVAARGAGIVAGAIGPMAAMIFVARGAVARRALICALAAAAAGLLVVIVFDRPAALFGVPVREVAPGSPGFEAAILRAVSALFPAAAVLPLVIVLPVAGSEGTGARMAIAFAVFVSLGLALQVRLTGVEQPPVPVGAIAVLCAAIFDRLLERAEGAPAGALIAGAGVFALWSGFSITPSQLGGPHWLGAIEWPKDQGSIGRLPLVLAGFAAVGAGGLVAVADRRLRALLLLLALASGTALSLYSVHVLSPRAHEKQSLAAQLAAYREHAPAGEPLIAYHAGKRAIAFQLGAPIIELDDRADRADRSDRSDRSDRADRAALLARFAASPCAHALIPRTELGLLHIELGEYYLISPPRDPLLLIARCLRAGTRDLNPLRAQVSRTPFPAPSTPVRAEFGPFAILGYDAPSKIARDGGPLHVRVHFAVTGTVAPDARVFLYLEAQIGRIAHDDVPVEGLYPTEAWRPGDFVIDDHQIEIEDSESLEHVIFAAIGGKERLIPRPGPNVEAGGTRRVRLGSILIE